MAVVKPDEVQLTFEYRCDCGKPFLVPLKRDWSSPLYVMHMEREHEYLKRTLVQAQKDLLELASECVEAGVRPSVLKRADELRDLFNSLKRRFGVD